MAQVVPLHRRSASPPAEPGEVFLDAADARTTLAVTWQQDEGAVELTVSRDGARPATFLLDADDVLEFVRVLVEGVAEPGPVRLGPAATVLPLRER